MAMNIVSLLLAGVLLMVAFLHLLWAFKSSWPFSDETRLARAVVGLKDIEKMPSSLACFGVVICLLIGAALAVLLRQDLHMNPYFSRWIVLLGGTVSASAFLIRGIFGVMPAMERRAPEQPFLRLNRYYYSPLCFLIGVGFALLVLAYPNWTWRLSQLF